MLEFLDAWLFSRAPIDAVQHLLGPGRPAPFRVLSLLGDTWGMMLVVGLALWWWGRRPAYAVLASIALGAGFKQLLSITFSVDRPVGEGTDIRVYEDIEVSSFPSGHVLQTTVPWGLLWLRGCVPLLVPAALTLAVALGRLYLGLHYVADVAAGALFAVLFLAAFRPAWRRAAPWLARRSLRTWAVVAVVLVLGLGGNLWWTGAADNPRRWEILGLVAGGAAGLLAEARFVRYAPAVRGWGRRAAVLLLGLAGLAACFALDRAVGKAVLWIGVVSGSLGMLWVTLGVPWLLVRAGWGRSERRAPSPPGGGDGAA